MNHRKPAVLCPVLFVLCSCISIPAQPAVSSRSAQPAASAPASAGGRIATVTGTGRFGLSIRKEPGLSAERVATVPDGFQATVTGGPVGQDGAEWYRLQGPNVSGWASGAYLTFSAASATAVPASSAASAGAARATPISTPLAGIVSQLGRDANYTVNGSGIFVEDRLKPAVDHLAASKTASALLNKAAPAYLRLTVDHFPVTSEGGEFSTLGHSIKIADSNLQESLDVQATVISHELQHAADILVDHATPESPQDCVNLELRAFRTQETVWLELTKPSPPQTAMERQLDQLSHVVNTPGFADQLTKLYASECSSYSH
jgi:hypothetical protein